MAEAPQISKSTVATGAGIALVISALTSLGIPVLDLSPVKENRDAFEARMTTELASVEARLTTLIDKVETKGTHRWDSTNSRIETSVARIDDKLKVLMDMMSDHETMVGRTISLEYHLMEVKQRLEEFKKETLKHTHEEVRSPPSFHGASSEFVKRLLHAGLKGTY